MTQQIPNKIGAKPDIRRLHHPATIRISHDIVAALHANDGTAPAGIEVPYLGSVMFAGAATAEEKKTRVPVTTASGNTSTEQNLGELVIESRSFMSRVVGRMMGQSAYHKAEIR